MFGFYDYWLFGLFAVFGLLDTLVPARAFPTIRAWRAVVTYLLRRPDPADGRAVVLETTEAGQRLYRRIEEELVEEVARLAAGFDPGVRREMVRLLGRLATAAAARVERSGGCCRLG